MGRARYSWSADTREEYDMGKVVFSGHGGFETSTNPPMITVPERTEIHF